ncbi:MAG TPA: MaoC/PaaZ C-terminal domain-containing protein [Spirochaetota bacterium]|nr:hypothetical protein [Spirochaetota bacterium]HOD15760.1 MaoC/PaaZ C-terminal domain-containing protein [Spirochaetota bacterium]HPG51611.1 MaoC/PaaZ C-terminal domain-containing protein [Spirochaetota bacterium]HPN12696.1 MaoC/PaaZ C-terminal domain-containing protein [Spirochaetota bacterium]HQL80579.1 MaoC/PaaZ C-terminal domain-containing protein [Spirochaetota bacterium]
MKKGDTFTIPFEVTEKVYRGFTDIFEDRNPLHMDDGYAKGKGFREKVMYGNILNGFISCFIGERLPEKNVVLISQDIAYAKPVYLNDRLELRAEVEDVHDSVGIVEFRYQFVNASGVRVARGKIQIRMI